MYCPNCGNQNSTEQRFCRACGLSLEKIAQSLTEQLPTKASKSLDEQKERLEQLGFAALCVFGLGILSFVLYQVFSKLMLTQGPLVAVLGVLAAIIFIGSGLGSVILFAKAKELKEASAKRYIDQPTETPPDESTGKLLEPHSEPAFSVVERTTELLTVERKNNKSD